MLYHNTSLAFVSKKIYPCEVMDRLKNSVIPKRCGLQEEKVSKIEGMLKFEKPKLRKEI